MSDDPFGAVMADVHHLADIARDAVLREAALELRVGRLEEALRAARDNLAWIAANAEAWHGPPPDMGHVRALGVIARTARAALVRTGEEHGTSKGQEREAPQAVPVAEEGRDV